MSQWKKTPKTAVTVKFLSLTVPVRHDDNIIVIGSMDEQFSNET